LNNYSVFTDVSLNPKIKKGLGAYLFLPASYLELPLIEIVSRNLIKFMQFQSFEFTSSTQLEVETVLWAMKDILKIHQNDISLKLHLYTDSQCVAGLLGRRQKLEQNKFISKATKQPLLHAELYKEFYELYDEIRFDVTKVAGHAESYTHDTRHRIFSYLDKAVRQKAKNSLW
jgi:ribonuclease HI